MEKMVIAVLLALVGITHFTVYGQAGHAFTKHWELLSPPDLAHRLVKRDIQQNSPSAQHVKDLHFKTLGRDFLLELKPKKEILHSSFNAYEVDKDGSESPIQIGKKPNVQPINISNRSVKVNASQDTQTSNHNKIFKRPKRATAEVQRSYALRPHKTRCSLLLVADYRFYRAMGGGNSTCTTNYLISLIDSINQIFLNTTWRDKPDEVGFDGMGFVIKKIVVHSEPTKTQNDELHYNMKKDNWNARTLLDVFSRDPTHKEFCLTHLFTDIKFEGANPGLAYVGSPRRNSFSGICNKEYYKDGHTLYFNSGLSSCRNRYGQRITRREAELVTAHQFGHNWGAKHDPEGSPECDPKVSEGGSYLMRHSYVSGNDHNNERFSPCSLRSIRKVLLTKSEKCFLESEEPACGNQKVEEGEECDAGWRGAKDLDKCCHSDCTLRRGALCSDKNSVCCQSCQPAPADQKCQDTDKEEHNFGNPTVEFVFIGNISGNCSYSTAVSKWHLSRFSSIFIGLCTIGTWALRFYS